MQVITVKTSKKKEVVDITDNLEEVLRKEKVKDGVCNLFVTHTTAALTVADLDPGTDQVLLDAYTGMVPKIDYRHSHNPSHVGGHILSALIGVSLNVPFKQGKLILGTWQRVVLIDFDGPRERSVNIWIPL
ncbi:MAG: secondary thiamine-phosphate synthase enzyme YjbQ [Patescibacteria group bacterium]